MKLTDLMATTESGDQYPAWPILRPWLPDRGLAASAAGAVLVDVQPHVEGAVYVVAEREGERLHNWLFWDGPPTTADMVTLLQAHLGRAVDTLAEVELPPS